jgi:hypothetical protein
VCFLPPSSFAHHCNIRCSWILVLANHCITKQSIPRSAAAHG